jgi:NitT/TauT family transport system substrate-binding protein
MHIIPNRRRFLTSGLSMAGVGSVASLLSARRSLAIEPSPETTSVRLSKDEGICIAPQYLVEDLLRDEGFTDIKYVLNPTATLEVDIARGQVDFSLQFVGPIIIPIDAGKPIVMLAGVHPGCFELFVREGIHRVVDLKGKQVGVHAVGAPDHIFLSVIAAHVGLDPAKDIVWITSEKHNELDLFPDGKIDALLGFPPRPQELRKRNIGSVILNSSVDRPWSQYFCCMLVGNVDFVRSNPVATKRVVRAILRATELCASDPTLAAQRLVERKYVSRYDYALQTLQDVPYGKWRDYDPEDTVRFYALRLHEIGMIRSSPHKIVVNGTDWRFLNEVKRELGI